jgi:hypothetical protein
MIPAALALAATTILQFQASNKGFDLNVQVVEALESGPVILDVTLTNRKDRIVTLPRTTRNESCCRVPDEWVDRLHFQCGGTGLPPVDLDPGKSLTERHLLHVDFASKFSPGTDPITVYWPLRNSRTDELRALPFKTIQVTIVPASAENLMAFERRLSKTLDAIPADGSLVPRLQDLSDRVVNTAHKSLIPFELKLLDKCPIRPDRLSDPTSRIRRELVATIFGLEPATAHHMFVDRFVDKNQSGDPAVIFSVWEFARYELHSITRGNRWSQIISSHFGHWNSAWLLNDVAMLASTSLFQAPLRLLPDDELLRLARADDFWIKVLTFATFADRLDKDWQNAFLKTVAARRPVATLDARGQICMDFVSDMRPGGARLLDTFAAGPDEDVITKIARKNISYRAK